MGGDSRIYLGTLTRLAEEDATLGGSGRLTYGRAFASASDQVSLLVIKIKFARQAASFQIKAPLLSIKSASSTLAAPLSLIQIGRGEEIVVSSV